jgi:predicted permease
VGAGYFETLRIPVLKGRTFEEQDDAGRPLIAIVNEAFVRRHLPGEEPLGRKVRMYGSPREIVGVVKDVRFRGLAEPAMQTVYLPLRQNPMSEFSLAVKTSVEPATLADAVRREIRQIDPELAVFGVVTIEEALAESLAFRRFLMTLAAVFAGIALLLASAGLFGVVSYSVSQRKQEFGVRMALGAGRGQVLLLVLRQGLLLSAAGVGVGLMGAAALTQLLRSQLYAVEPADPLTYGVVAAVFVLVSLLASYEPARRATNLSPVEALRDE